MLESFKGFIGYTEEEFKNIWEKAIFTVDTNVLLNFYKYTSQESRNVLLDILKELKKTDRLWISHQVALEYFFNYEATMSKPHEGYNLFQKEIKKLDKNTGKVLSTVKTEHPYIETEKFEVFIDDMKKVHEEINEKVNEELEKLPKADVIKDEILSLFEGVIGGPYRQEDIDAIEKEGAHRYTNEVPPGFMDKNKKENIRVYGNIKYDQKYGDLLLWYQMIDKASADKLPIIFVTEEKKEDWWQIENGLIKRPQPHLIQEFIERSTQSFFMYRTEMFIKYASHNFNIEITSEQVESITRDVEKIRKIEDEKNMSMNMELLQKDILKYNNKAISLEDVSLNSLVKFLSNEEKKEFTKKIKNNLLVKDINELDDQYKKIIGKAIYQVQDRVQRKVESKLNEVLELNLDKWKYYVKKITEYPGGSIDNTVMLMNCLEEMEYWLVNESLPF